MLPDVISVFVNINNNLLISSYRVIVVLIQYHFTMTTIAPIISLRKRKILPVFMGLARSWSVSCQRILFLVVCTVVFTVCRFLLPVNWWRMSFWRRRYWERIKSVPCWTFLSYFHFISCFIISIYFFC